MRKQILFLACALFISMDAFAGGTAAEATIEKVIYSSDSKIIVDIKWKKETGFLEGTTQTRLVFDLYNFEGFHFGFKSKMPREKFAECLNFIFDAYKTGSTIEIGQMVSGRLRADKDVPGALVAPYAEVLTTFSGQKACFIFPTPSR